MGGALPTTLIGETVANLTAGQEVFFASGTFNASTGLFTISTDGAGPDTMIIQADNAVGASDNLTTNASAIILQGVNSADLAAGNFGNAANVYTVTAATVINTTTGVINPAAGTAGTAAALLALGFTTLSGGVIGDVNTLTIDATGTNAAQTFNQVSGVFTGAADVASNQLLYTGVDTVNFGNGANTYTANNVAAGTTTVNGGTGVDTLAYVGGAAAINLGTSTVVTGFENINASAATGAVTATLVAGSTAYVTSANADDVTFANATGNAVAVNAAALANDTAVTFRTGNAGDIVTVSNLIGDITATTLASQLVVNLADNTADGDIAITTGTASTTVQGGVAGDAVTVASAALTDGNLLTLAGASTYTVTGQVADLLTTASGAVGTTLGTAATITATNNGSGLLTIANGTFADDATLTTAGTGAVTITGFLGNLVNSASGAVTVTLAQTADADHNIESSTAITIANGTVADGEAITISGAGAFTRSLKLSPWPRRASSPRSTICRPTRRILART